MLFKIWVKSFLKPFPGHFYVTLQFTLLSETSLIICLKTKSCQHWWLCHQHPSYCWRACLSALKASLLWMLYDAHSLGCQTVRVFCQRCCCHHSYLSCDCNWFSHWPFWLRSFEYPSRQLMTCSSCSSGHEKDLWTTDRYHHESDQSCFAKSTCSRYHLQLFGRCFSHLYVESSSAILSATYQRYFQTSGSLHEVVSHCFDLNRPLVQVAIVRLSATPCSRPLIRSHRCVSLCQLY